MGSLHVDHIGNGDTDDQLQSPGGRDLRCEADQRAKGAHLSTRDGTNRTRIVRLGMHPPSPRRAWILDASFIKSALSACVIIIFL